MLIEANVKKYKHYFPVNNHPFISESFIELNKGKAERVVRLIEDTRKPGMGFVAGLKDNYLKSPFSAPFGGFHFRKDIMYVSEIDNFITLLQEYIRINGLKGIQITLPPDIYHLTFNSKIVNTLIHKGFINNVPEITNWVDLANFGNSFTNRSSREYLRQAQRNGLIFRSIEKIEEKKAVYKLIAENRARHNRPIYMSFEDVINTSELWPTDFFSVYDKNDFMVASAIFYRFHKEIVYALFWGDNEAGRPLRAMDFLSYKLWQHYKDQGFKYIDLGISTETGKPNEGLLRFKETHDAVSSLKYSFTWGV